MAQTQKLRCLPKQAPLTDGTSETQNRIANMASSSQTLGPNYSPGRKIPFTLENREILNNFHV